MQCLSAITEIICHKNCLLLPCKKGRKKEKTVAYIQMNLFSKTLMRIVSVNVILPADKMVSEDMPVQQDLSFKTLYLLHGIMGNCADWINGTRIQRYAEENNLAVVMPSGDNAFYLDHPKGHNYYGEFVGQELVELTRKMFPLSHNREDTYIGGLSMGGYGAIRNGLKYHETFGGIIALSSALIIQDLKNWSNDAPLFFERRDYAEAVFGNLEEAVLSDRNPEYLVNQLKKDNSRFPAIFMACGEDDFLLKHNVDFVKYLEKNEVEVTFLAGPGRHEWDFWDTYIKKAIEWLPL